MHLFRRIAKANRVFWFNTVNRMPRITRDDLGKVVRAIRGWGNRAAGEIGQQVNPQVGPRGEPHNGNADGDSGIESGAGNCAAHGHCSDCHGDQITTANQAILAQYTSSAHGSTLSEAWRHYDWRSANRSAEGAFWFCGARTLLSAQTQHANEPAERDKSAECCFLQR